MGTLRLEWRSVFRLSENPSQLVNRSACVLYNDLLTGVHRCLMNLIND
jgi:hypothetical protein